MPSPCPDARVLAPAEDPGSFGDAGEQAAVEVVKCRGLRYHMMLALNQR